MERITHRVGGSEFVGHSNTSGPVFNPATGEQTSEVVFAEAGDVDDVVSVAEPAARAWAETSLARRTEILFRVRAILDSHRADIARLITQDHGKVLADAMGEVARGIENVDFACGIARSLAGHYAEQASSGVDVYSMRQPLGVVAGITPFNFPAMVPMWMLRQRHRMRECLHPQALRKGSAGLGPDR